MKYTKTILVAFMFATKLSAFANDIKFEVLKTTVWFINQDRKANSQNVKEEFKGNSIAELAAHYKQLSGIEKKINELNSINIPANLDQNKQIDFYIDTVVKVITQGEKKYRKELPEFAQYLSQLNVLKQEPSSDVLPKTNETSSEENLNLPQKQNQNEETLSTKTGIDFLPYVLALLGLLGAGVVYFLLNSKISKMEKDNKMLHSSDSKISNKDWLEVEKLIDRKLAAFKESIKKEIVDFKNEENNNVQIDNKKAVENNNSINKKEAQETKPITIETPKKKFQFFRMAEYQDGFNLSSARDNSDNQCVFRVCFNNDETTYEVNPDQSIQAIAIRNFDNYFSKVAVYDSFPNNATKIECIPGKIRIENNKLVITEKMKIKFV